MLELLDYRHQIFAMYQHIRQLGSQQPEAFAVFRQTRDTLFAHHSQSALDSTQKATFTGLNYYPYNPAYRVVAPLIPIAEPVTYQVQLGDDGAFAMQQIGEVHFTLPTGSGHLGVFWIMGYGGGIFIPFRDSTNTTTTYGGGRYLYDTIKGADLGLIDRQLLLDFNYAYHPSCYYNPRWVCPLAPPANQLALAVEAGEQRLSA